MYEVYKVCGIAIITIVLTSVLKNHSSSVAKYLPQIASIVIFIGAIGSIRPLISFIKSLIAKTSSGENYLSVIISAGAIALVFGTVSEICKENGENFLKSALIFAGNTQIILLSLPILKELILKASNILTV